MTYRRAHLILVLLLLLAASPASADDGKTIFLERCAFCHGATGKGDGPAGLGLTPPPKDFTSPSYWQAADPQRLREIIENGKDGTAMVPFKQIMNEQQIDAVHRHLLSLRPQ